MVVLMIGKGANTIRPATLAEVEKILDKRQSVGGGEFGFEQQTSLEYAKRFSHLKYSEASEMLGELEKLEVKTETAVKIVDLLPKNKSQLMLILSKDKVELSEKKLAHAEEIIATYSKKAKKFEPKVEALPAAAVPAEGAPAAPADEGDEKGKEKKSG
jgi:DNA-directed RNA polymerase subunit F